MNRDLTLEEFTTIVSLDPRLTDHEKRVLIAARGLTHEGGKFSESAIAERAGMSKEDVHVTCLQLAAKGLIGNPASANLRSAVVDATAVAELAMKIAGDPFRAMSLCCVAIQIVSAQDVDFDATISSAIAALQATRATNRHLNLPGPPPAPADPERVS